MTTYIARRPVDLLALVPWVLGFHPEDSVVLLTFDGAESFHARADLPSSDDERSEVTRMLRDLVARRGVAQVGLVLYTDDAVASMELHDAVLPVLAAIGVEVVDVLRVSGDRYYAVTDPDDQGQPFDLDSHSLTVSRLAQGERVHESRAALSRSLAGDDLEDVAAVSVAADRAADQLLDAVARGTPEPAGDRPSLGQTLAVALGAQGRWLQSRIRAGLTDPEAIDVSDAGRMLVLVALESLREVAWAEMTRSNSVEQVGLWRALVRRAPHDLRAAPASLLAFAAWLGGKGALAWCALDRCFEVDPADALGEQVAALLESATPPSVWAPIPQSALRVFGEPGEAGG